MHNELLALGVPVALVTAIVAARFLHTERARWLVAVGMAGVAGALSIGATVLRPARVQEQQVATRPIEVPDAGYVSSTTCQACHAREYQTWHDSYHRKMTRRADPQSVLGDFENVTLQVAGQSYRLERRGDEFWVEMDNPLTTVGTPGSRVHYPITMTTGSHNMQAYWYETGFTRTTGLLPFTWQVAEGRWIPRRSAFVLPPSDPINPALGIWSLTCIKCHATHARPRLDYDTTGLHGADTQVSEFGIACEACHGPGASHVAANQNPARRYALHLSGEPDPTIVNPSRLDAERATQVCGQCHGQFDYQFDVPRMHAWFEKGFSYRPGDDVLKDRKVKFEGEEQFWADGLIRVAGREYNALLGSACHDRGQMTCLSCHQMHQSSADQRPRSQWADDQLRDLDGDQTCLQCHASYAKDVPAHSHHLVDSAGSSCQNCHMPHTTYGLMKGVRTHRIASPSVASTLATGRPNACNQCHLDQTLAWTAQHLEDWYGTKAPELAVDNTKVAASVQWILKGDAAQRALMAWSLGWAPARQASGSDWMVPYLAELLDDPYPVVRIIAERSLRTLPGYETFRHQVEGTVEARQAEKLAVLETWQKAMPAVGDERRSTVLLGPDGRLHSSEFARLLKQRNYRLVRLFE